MSQTSSGLRCRDTCYKWCKLVSASLAARLAFAEAECAWAFPLAGSLCKGTVRISSWYAGSGLGTRYLDLKPSTRLLAGSQAGLHKRGIARAAGVQEPARGHRAALRAGARV